MSGKPFKADSPEALELALRIEAYGQRAVRDALRVHKALGQYIVVWEDGKVRRIPPEEIDVVPIEDDPLEYPMPEPIFSRRNR